MPLAPACTRSRRLTPCKSSCWPSMGKAYPYHYVLVRLAAHLLHGKVKGKAAYAFAAGTQSAQKYLLCVSVV